MPSILQGRDRKPAPEKERPGQSAAADEHTPEHDENSGESTSTLTSHGDGTHTIQHEDGSTTDHPHIGHALMTLAGKHSDGLHHHTHSDGMSEGHTVHTAAHGDPAEGPHDHENLDSVKDGMDQFFGEEEQEDGKDEAGKDAGKRGGATQTDYD